HLERVRDVPTRVCRRGGGISDRAGGVHARGRGLVVEPHGCDGTVGPKRRPGDRVRTLREVDPHHVVVPLGDVFCLKLRKRRGRLRAACAHAATRSPVTSPATISGSPPATSHATGATSCPLISRSTLGRVMNPA